MAINGTRQILLGPKNVKLKMFERCAIFTPAFHSHYNIHEILPMAISLNV